MIGQESRNIVFTTLGFPQSKTKHGDRTSDSTVPYYQGFQYHICAQGVSGEKPQQEVDC
jgi:hypothetical protein